MEAIAWDATRRRRTQVGAPRARQTKREVLPGFEPGSLDSKSRVLTITP